VLNRKKAPALLNNKNLEKTDNKNPKLGFIAAKSTQPLVGRMRSGFVVSGLDLKLSRY
jgi:hypothetical protein